MTVHVINFVLLCNNQGQRSPFVVRESCSKLSYASSNVSDRICRENWIRVNEQSPNKDSFNRRYLLVTTLVKIADARARVMDLFTGAP